MDKVEYDFMSNMHQSPKLAMDKPDSPVSIIWAIYGLEGSVNAHYHHMHCMSYRPG